jgi:hypothetical protein
MINELAFADVLAELDLGPLLVEVEQLDPPGGGDAHLILIWDGDRVPFVAEFKNARDLRTLQYTVRQALRWADRSKREPLVVVPYLNDDWLAFLRTERMSGIDLSGNGCVQVPGRWSFLQRGFASRFPDTRRTRAPYRGKSAFVGRVLLSRPRFDTIGEVQKEIERRGGSLSLGQVSKVLSALEEDLVIRKGDNGVSLIQPERLLASLVEGYRQPKAVQEVDLNVRLGPDLLKELSKGAKGANARVAGYDPARFVIAPEAGERLLVYIEPRGLASVSQIPQTGGPRRFANLTIRAIREPWVYFDAEEDRGFTWCSPLEVYLQLMQGGKREQETATQLREEILSKAASTP